MTAATLTRPRKTIDLPVQLDEVTALDPSVIAAKLGDARRARRWLTDVVNATPDVLESHIELSRVAVLVERALPGAALPGTMDVAAAIARDDWQAAYDLSMSTTQGSASALASLLLVADGLNASGQPDAAINLLSQALDLYEQTPAIYWALIQVMVQQGRIDDAESALILLRDALQTV
jgi:tetratricopeptide (TPR) repeat protein